MHFKNGIALLGSFGFVGEKQQLHCCFSPTSLENIIIAVGINHRGLNLIKTTLTDMNKLQSALAAHSTQNAFMIGVSTGSNLTTEEASNIKLNNDKIKTD